MDQLKAFIRRPNRVREALQGHSSLPTMCRSWPDFNWYSVARSLCDSWTSCVRETSVHRSSDCKL